MSITEYLYETNLQKWGPLLAAGTLLAFASVETEMPRIIYEYAGSALSSIEEIIDQLTDNIRANCYRGL